MSDDNLLIAYDFILGEFVKYNKRINDAVESRGDTLPLPGVQKEVGDDFAYFANDWEDIVASAKNRYGADDVERVLAHLGFDKNGKRRISFSGT